LDGGANMNNAPQWSFSAMVPGFDFLPTPFLFVQKFYDPYSIQSILHSAFAGSAVVISFLILKDKEISDKNILEK